MGFGKWKEIIPSDKSKQFEEGQKVSFIYRKEIRSGIIAVLLINSAVINIIDSSKPKNKKEKNKTTCPKQKRKAAVFGKGNSPSPEKALEIKENCDFSPTCF